MQAGLMAVISMGLILLMIRNISCRKNSCGINKNTGLDNDTQSIKNKKDET